MAGVQRQPVRHKQRSAYAVKKLFVCFAVAAATAGFAMAPVQAQEKAAAAAAGTHQVGLIDMAHVFKNYDKFKSMTEDMQADAKKAQSDAEGMVEQMKQIQTKMQGLQEGSPDYAKQEEQILTLQSKLETFRKVQQREFLRKEAEIYKTVYMEVQEAVQKYAKYYKYTLIIRFNRQSVDAAENPQEIITSMNRQVVYYRDQDDLTDPILNFLNDEYKKASGGAAPAREAKGASPAANR
jgi:Skp family chaperone for outer membrane proteins